MKPNRFCGMMLGVLIPACGAVLAQEAPKREAAQVAGWLEKMDKDGDGKLAKAEAKGLMLRFFDQNDANKDGTLDGKELEALAKRLAKRQQANRQRPPRTAGLPDLPDDVVMEADIAYREGTSKRWKLDLVMPKATSGKPRPGIVFVHGGGWRSGDKRSGTFMNGAVKYAQKGYVCITVNYRLVDEAPFPACVHDVKNAVRWFRAHAEKYNLDPERIGAFGNSAGAHLVSMLGLVGKDVGLEGDGPYQGQSSLVQAVCAAATPTDFKLFSPDYSRMGRPGGLLAGPAETLMERGRLASPISHVRKGAPPFLLFHGTKDTTVSVEHGDAFVEALKKAGAKDVTYLRIDGAGHGVYGQRKDKTFPAMEQFFARTLKEK